MENDILDTLEDLGYEGPLLEDSLFNAAVEDGPRSVEFTKLVSWATSELCGFFSIEEKVTPIEEPDDCDTFLMELSGFLREYGCPYQNLVEGPMGQRLDTKENKLALLDYILSELQASRMISVHKPNMVKKVAESETLTENESAKDLKAICVALGFPRPPEGITPFQLFSKVESKIKEILKTLPSTVISKPLLKARLSPKQWESVEFVNKALKQEYEVRREMLLKRLDVTIQSFMWSEKAKKQENEITNTYQPIRRGLNAKPNVGIAQMLSAREDLTRIQKTSSGAARERTKCPINRVKIGKVPDRGGRAYEMEPPPPEMPSFQKRSNDPQGQRGGGRDDRRGGGGRGGRGGGYGGRGGGGDSRPHSASSQGGGGGGWGGGAAPVAYGQQQQSSGQAFFGGNNQGSGYQSGGYQQNQGYQQGGYQQGGYQQPYQQGGYQQGYQQGGGGGGYGYQQQGGYQQGGGGGGGYQGGGGGGGGGGYQGGRGGRGGGGGGGGGGGHRGRGGRGRGRGGRGGRQ